MGLLFRCSGGVSADTHSRRNQHTVPDHGARVWRYGYWPLLWSVGWCRVLHTGSSLHWRRLRLVSYPAFWHLHGAWNERVRYFSTLAHRNWSLYILTRHTYNGAWNQGTFYILSLCMMSDLFSYWQAHVHGARNQHVRYFLTRAYGTWFLYTLTHTYTWCTKPTRTLLFDTLIDAWSIYILTRTHIGARNWKVRFTYWHFACLVSLHTDRYTYRCSELRGMFYVLTVCMSGLFTYWHVHTDRVPGTNRYVLHTDTLHGVCSLYILTRTHLHGTRRQQERLQTDTLHGNYMVSVHTDTLHGTYMVSLYRHILHGAYMVSVHTDTLHGAYIYSVQTDTLHGAYMVSVQTDTLQWCLHGLCTYRHFALVPTLSLYTNTIMVSGFQS